MFTIMNMAALVMFGKLKLKSVLVRSMHRNRSLSCIVVLFVLTMWKKVSTISSSQNLFTDWYNTNRDYIQYDAIFNHSLYKLIQDCLKVML